MVVETVVEVVVLPADGWYNYIDFLGRTVVFPAPTDATNEMLRAIREEVDALYIEGTRYRKTGIMFFGLEKPGTAHQTDLFDDTPPAEKSDNLADNKKPPFYGGFVGFKLVVLMTR